MAMGVSHPKLARVFLLSSQEEDRRISFPTTDPLHIPFCSDNTNPGLLAAVKVSPPIPVFPL